MHFAPDTENTLEFAVTLGNTHPSASRSGLDELATPADLTALLDRLPEAGVGNTSKDAS